MGSPIQGGIHFDKEKKETMNYNKFVSNTKTFGLGNVNTIANTVEELKNLLYLAQTCQ
eukprot:Pgem_evm1s2821